MKKSKNSKEKLIQSLFLKWYLKNKRELPWRKLEKNRLPNPYYTLVSEFMLQQTTVTIVTKRFNEFIGNWPSLEDLNKIKENTILKFWSGLGYYNRAKNLLKTSKIISKDFKSNIPKNYDQLIVLPGIGEYTAKAIMGIAYNKPIMPLDVNIERIIVRLYGITKPISSSKKEIKNIASNYHSSIYSSNLIQSFMDYGSAVCLPRKPKCNQCIVDKYCEAKKNNIQNLIPFKKKLEKKKKIKFTRAYIIENNLGEILIRRRKSKGMLASMLEIPNDIWMINKNKLVQDEIIDKVRSKMQFKKSIEYSFSHFNLEIEVFFLKVKKNIFKDQKWVKIKNIDDIGFPTVMKKIVKEIYG